MLTSLEVKLDKTKIGPMLQNAEFLSFIFKKYFTLAFVDVGVSVIHRQTV